MQTEIEAAKTQRDIIAILAQHHAKDDVLVPLEREYHITFNGDTFEKYPAQILRLSQAKHYVLSLIKNN